VAQEQPDAVFFSGTAMGRDLAPRVAARLGVGAIADVVGLSLNGSSFSARRPVYSGKAFATVDTAGKSPQVISLRPNVFGAVQTGGSAEVVALDGLELSIRAVVKELLDTGGGELDVAEADIIVSGGRGIKGPENFALIRELADALGAAVGASRAVVDAGWIEHKHQVGQTGKVVSPSLYVACGISGAIQHLAGMSSSKVIVAINKDPDAPIFKVADFGVVGDLFDVVPPMVEAIKQL
jgi:electron transfer flavoprotein alpha subunit